MKRLKCVIKIAELRERLGINSQKELADMAGLRPNAVSQLEHGYRWKSGERAPLQRVDLEHLEKIANAIWREKGVRVLIGDLLDIAEVEE